MNLKPTLRFASVIAIAFSCLDNGRPRRAADVYNFISKLEHFFEVVLFLNHGVKPIRSVGNFASLARVLQSAVKQ